MKMEAPTKTFFALGLLVSFLTFAILGILFLQPPKYQQKTEISDNVLNITFYTDRSLLPGETSNFYFEIINKGNKTIKQIEIDLKVLCLGRTVYEKNGTSIRDYEQGEKITVLTPETMPVITPPGDYLFQFHFRPDNLSERYLEQKLYVRPSLYQLSISLSSSVLFGLLLLYFEVTKNAIKSFRSFIKKNLESFTVGQKFVFWGIASLILTSFVLAFGLESSANEFVIIAYFLLVLGVLNILLEYIRRVDSKVNYALSIYSFAAFVLLSIHNGLGEPIGETIAAFAVTYATLYSLTLEKNGQRKIAKYLAVILSLWILYDLFQGRVQYCGVGLILALVLYLSRKR